VGKQLPANVYELITYIEANTLDEEAQQHIKKRKVLAERAKVLRETRLIPKVIMVIEDFNKHIILLSKKLKSQNRLTDYLHLGTMRDFDIKSTDLKAAIERSISDGRNISIEDSNAEDQDPDKDEDEDEDKDSDVQSTTYPEESEEEHVEPVVVEKSGQRRRRALSSETETSQPKRKRGRKADENPEGNIQYDDQEEEHPETTSKLRWSKKDSKDQQQKPSQALESSRATRKSGARTEDASKANQKSDVRPSDEVNTKKKSNALKKKAAEPTEELPKPEEPVEKKKSNPSRRLGIPRSMKK